MYQFRTSDLEEAAEHVQIRRLTPLSGTTDGHHSLVRSQHKVMDEQSLVSENAVPVDQLFEWA
jgi:hypothetical protein